MESQAAIDVAFEMAMRSHEISNERWNAINSVFHVLLSTIISVTFSIPILSRALNICLQSELVMGALIFFTVNLIVCLYGRMWGSLATFDIKILSDHYVNQSAGISKKML